MSFVKTADEVAEIQRLLTATRYVVDQLVIGFRTTEEFVREVLPPCLGPAEKPSGMAAICRGQSSFCGEYDLAWVGLNARYGEIEGIYTLSMLVSGDSGDMPVILGREVWGEVKKHARLGYSHDGPRVRGYAERHGVRVVEIEATLEPVEVGPRSLNYATLDIKAYPAADAVGFQSAPLLVVLDVEENDDTVRRGEGRLTLRGTPHDPLDTIPIVSTGRALQAMGETIFTFRALHELPDSDALLPYVYGRAYDDLSLFPRPLRYEAAGIGVGH
jgi:acetoacetate decarboxylase